MFGVFPAIMGFSTCSLEFFRRLPCQLFSLRGGLVRVLAGLVSRLIGLFFLRAAIVSICGAIASSGTDQQTAYHDVTWYPSHSLPHFELRGAISLPLIAVSTASASPPLRGHNPFYTEYGLCTVPFGVVYGS
jgi:hypothetical protein